MVKKLTKICFEVLFIGLCLYLVLLSTDIFKDATWRLLEGLDLLNVQTFFEKFDSASYIKMYIEEIQTYITNIIDYLFFSDIPFYQIVLDFIELLWNWILDLIIYFCNFGLTILLVLWIILHETFSKEEERVRYTKGALIYFKYQYFKHLIYSIIRDKLHQLFNLIKKYKKTIFIHFCLIMLAKGYLYYLIVEFLIFIEVYIIRLIQTETYLLMFSLFGYIFVQVIEFLRTLPDPILVMLFILFFFIEALTKAKYKLKMNHERLKKFVREDITQTTFINGPPGSGKTLLNCSLTLAAEENFIEELEKNMLDYEIKYPECNMAPVRLKQVDNHEEYYKFYEIERFRKSYIVSNYSIYTPYFMTYSKIFDFDNMRKNKKIEKYALEEYIVISISELDKEYNSHDNMKEVGQDGAATFYSTVSHDLKRHVKIFCDYQLKDQVPLRIRGNSEYFFTIESRKKKYPFLLYLYYLPFIIIQKLLRACITKYESTRKTINKKTLRKSISKFKRNDFTFLYALLRRLAFSNEKICKFFDHYWFFKMTGDLSIKDGEKGQDKTLNLNLCDLEIDDHKLYDSTFLSFAYESKKNFKFKDLDEFTSLTPSVEELTKCNSRFYNKLNNIESPFDDDITEKTNDDFIDL